MRFALLQTVGAQSAGALEQSDGLNLCSALARQCFINEYVFDLTEDEAAQVERLRAAVSSDLRSGRAVAPAKLVMLAAHVPLHVAGRRRNLLDKEWPPAVADVLTQQVREPRQERELRSSIPMLTDIDDSVSIAVRQQYEENPYPRWVRGARAGSSNQHRARPAQQAAASPIRKPRQKRRDRRPGRRPRHRPAYR